MTPEDVKNNKSQINCFWCQSSLGNYPTNKYLIITDEVGDVIQIKRMGDTKASPMVYCSSDCMIYESHLRYCDRVKRGVFRKNFDVEFGGDTHQYMVKRQLPEAWKEEGEQLVGTNKVG